VILRDPDLDTWREVARAFLDQHVDTRDLPAGPRVDRTLWQRACEQLGAAGLDVAEEHGGAAAGFGAVAVLLEECGRVLAPLPVLNATVAAPLLAGGDDAGDLLAGLVDGSVVVTVALDAEVELRDGTAHGRLDRVMDGMSADLLLCRSADGQLLAVDLTGPGAERTLQESTDLTRDFAQIVLSDAPARVVAGHLSAELVNEARHRLLAGFACEQLGGAERVLEDAVRHTMQRIQFGRVLASFQALKHRCADLVVDVDLARSAAEHAAWAVQEGAADRALAVSIAGATCGPTYLQAALENVQLHGGIGFTWEHTAHLHARRAESDLALTGGAERLRDDVLVSLGV
jgi:alkylation response protein AidB-like acyl-CoA dehydrogenase